MTLLEVVVTMVWACLAISPRKNPVFSHVFYNEGAVGKICADARLDFCRGLLDAIQAAQPPTIEFFKTLPTNILNRWGVYALVLEKVGHLPIVYIGSASDALRGIHSRWTFYDKCNRFRPNVADKACPSNARKALNSGYKTVHKGLLAWAPIPATKDVPHFRVLFYALEAMFSYCFWSMSSTAIGIEIISCCRWSIEAFTYRGGCSHYPLVISQKFCTYGV